MTGPDGPPAQPDVLVRPGTVADLAEVADVHLRSRRAAHPAMPPGAHPDTEVRSWFATWDLSARELWVAQEGGRVVAYAALAGDWLDDLYVLPGAAGRGLGSLLLETVKAQRPDGFCLWVFETNTAARAFYARHGLVELERTDGSANEERAPDLRVTWPGREPLVFLRGLIDEVDDQLGDLLARRAALTAAVQPHKGHTRRDPDRERAIAVAMAQRAPALGVERLHRIVDVVITESLDAAREG